ncbi:MAG TPA: hypothetical protein VNU71_21260 [Burkholderiaceae bacterium]|nr:hypothetical protein [Burkholderiaceae bacterium]
MSSALRIVHAGVATLAMLSGSAAALADESNLPASAPPVAEAARPSRAAPVLMPLEPAAARRGPFASKPVPAATLAARRGGERVFNDAQLKGVVADNQASNLTTGMNVISEGAFSGASGLSTVIQNSGNNVLIQNATIVNVQLK